jgi:hypothetical protein
MDNPPKLYFPNVLEATFWGAYILIGRGRAQLLELLVSLFVGGRFLRLGRGLVERHPDRLVQLLLVLVVVGVVAGAVDDLMRSMF